LAVRRPKSSRKISTGTGRGFDKQQPTSSIKIILERLNQTTQNETGIEHFKPLSKWVVFDKD
jgi:hypothetical protein